MQAVAEQIAVGIPGVGNPVQARLAVGPVVGVGVAGEVGPLRQPVADRIAGVAEELAGRIVCSG